MTDLNAKISDEEYNSLNSNKKLREIKRIIKEKKLDFDKTHKEVGLLVVNKLSKDHVSIYDKEHKNTDDLLGEVTLSITHFLQYKIFADKDNEISKILDEWIDKNK